MKLERLEIENFKCFKKDGFEFSDLTILTGANSSGKSSLLYSILGALQSGNFPIEYSPNGKYVNLGDFDAISYKHYENNLIKLSFRFLDELEITHFIILIPSRFNKMSDFQFIKKSKA
jgi:predicted ATP-dependent endonuclease of OLD family